MLRITKEVMSSIKWPAAVMALGLLAVAGWSVEAAAGDYHRPYSTHDLRGTWTVKAWIDGTYLIPLPAEIVVSPGETVTVAPGDKVSVLGSLVGLVEFDGRGGIPSFRDVIKLGAVKPLAPFPLPFLPPLPEQGAGSYSVEADEAVLLYRCRLNVNIPVTGASKPAGSTANVLNRAMTHWTCRGRIS